MTTLYLKLLEFAGNYEAEKGLLHSPRAYIATKESSIKISSECCSSKEAEEAADWLIKELKTIKKQAAKFFKNQDEARRKMTDKSSKQ